MGVYLITDYRILITFQKDLIQSNLLLQTCTIRSSRLKLYSSSYICIRILDLVTGRLFPIVDYGKKRVHEVTFNGKRIRYGGIETG